MFVIFPVREIKKNWIGCREIQTYT